MAFNPHTDFQSLQQIAGNLGQFGNRPALKSMTREGVNVQTYADLACQVDALAAGMKKRGLEADETVVLFAGASAAWIVACLAVYRCGGCVVPVDAQFRDDTLKHVLDDSDARFAFADADTQNVLQEVDDGRLTVIDLDETGNHATISWRDLQEEGDACEKSFPSVSAEQRAALFYTSGTTGPPKGVPLTHKNLTFQLAAVGNSRLLDRRHNLLQPLPLHHVYPFVLGALAPLALGCTIVFPFALTGPQLIRAIRENDVTIIIGVPRLYAAMLEGIQAQLQSSGKMMVGITHFLMMLNRKLLQHTGFNIGRKLMFYLHRRVGGSLEMLACGGSPLEPALSRQLESLGWQVVVGYGLTETAPLLTLRLPEDRRPDSVGRAIQGVSLRIDTEAVQEVRHNDGLGEVLAKGPNVFAGYHHLQEETKESFDADGWFHTGDLGEFDNQGFLYIQGRRSTMIVTPGGENLQPETVEEVYVRHPAIAELGVFRRGDKLAAVVVPEAAVVKRDYNGDSKPAVSAALHSQSRQLPSYMRLNEHAISTAPLARTRLGKIRRHLLAEHFDAALKEGAGEAPEPGPMPIEQMSDHDQALLEDRDAHKIWNLIAERFADSQISPDTDMAGELGLDSLAWVSLTLDIRRVAGIELDEAAVGRIQTVRDLLQEVVEGAGLEDFEEGHSPLENPEEFLSEEQMKWVRPLNLFQRLILPLIYGMIWVFMKLVFRVHGKGLENIPSDKPVILTPNHGSYLDPFALIVVIGYKRLRSTYWAGWTGVAFRNVIFRAFSRLAQAVPIDARYGSLSSMAFAAYVLKREKHLVWFPEGRRSVSGDLQKLQGGLGVLLKELDVAVCPVHIDGAHSALPPGKFLPRPRRIRVTIGQVATPDQLAAEGEGTRREEKIVTGLRRQLIGLRKTTRLP